MRELVWSLLVVATSCYAFDATLLTTSTSREHAVSDILKDSQKPLVIGIKDFELAEFHRLAGAYNRNPPKDAFTEAINNFKNAIYFDNAKQVLSSYNLVDHVNSSASHDIKYLKFPLLEDLSGYLEENKISNHDTVIISSQEAFDNEPVLIRRKRVTSDVNFDDEDINEKQGQASSNLDASTKRFDMPVVLPPYDIQDSGKIKPNASDLCMLYLEALNLIVHKVGSSSSRSLIVDDHESKNKFGWSENYVDCKVDRHTIGRASFVIEIMVSEDIPAKRGDGSTDFTLPKGMLKLRLDFSGIQNIGFWGLESVELLDDFQLKKGNFLENDLTVKAGISDAANMSVGSVYQYCYACSQTPALFFNSSVEYPWKVGIGFNNFQVDLKLINSESRFGWLVSDCVGSFSAGSWMGIICAAVFIVIILFGYLMVQSIQTLDRFDDAKQKPIMINFKD